MTYGDARPEGRLVRLASTLRAYLNDSAVPTGTAYAVLRRAFLATFAAQAAVAAAVALAAVALAGRNVAPSPWIALVLIIAAGAQVALGGAVAAYGVRQAGRLARGLALHRGGREPDVERAGAAPPARAEGGPPVGASTEPEDGAAPHRDEQRRLRVARSAALSQTLLSAVLLSTPTWFVAFGWATGQRATTLLALLATAALGIAFGMMQVGPLARAVTVRPR